MGTSHHYVVSLEFVVLFKVGDFWCLLSVVTWEELSLLSIALRKKKNLTRQERSLNSSAVARRVTSVLRFKARPSSEQSQVSHSQTDSTQFQSKPNADYISLLPIADEHNYSIDRHIYRLLGFFPHFLHLSCWQNLHFLSPSSCMNQLRSFCSPSLVYFVQEFVGAAVWKGNVQEHDEGLARIDSIPRARRRRGWKGTFRGPFLSFFPLGSARVVYLISANLLNSFGKRNFGTLSLEICCRS